MATTKEAVKISRTELKKLIRKARAYDKLAAGVFELPLRVSLGEVVGDFRRSGLYTKGFLKDLESGLKKSSWRLSR